MGERIEGYLVQQNKPQHIMAITNFRMVQPSTVGLKYEAVVDTDGELVPIGNSAVTNDQQRYTLRYRRVQGAGPSSDTWDMGITFTNKAERNIDYEILDDGGANLFPHQDKPPVKDGI